MNKVQRLREVVKKLIPMIASRGIAVTQVGAQAFVRTDPKTRKPIQVNIPHLPDNADEALIFAVQGFIDHELGHVLDTDWDAVGESLVIGAKLGPSRGMTPKAGAQRLDQLHNIVEDPFVEAAMAKRFKGSAYNIDKLHDVFINRICKPGIENAKTPQDRFGCIVVPLVRSWAGQQKFTDLIVDNGYDKDPLVAALVKAVPDSDKARFARIKDSWEALELAKILFDIIHPEPPPPPPPQPSMADAINEEMKEQEKKDDEQSDSEKSDDADGEGNNQDKPEDEDDKGSDGEQSDEEQPADQENEAGDDGDIGEGEKDGEEGKEAEGEAGDDQDAGEGDAEDADAEGDQAGAGGRDDDQDEDELADGDEAGEGDADDGEDDDTEDGDGDDQAGGPSGSSKDDQDEGDDADGDDAAGDDEGDAEEEKDGAKGGSGSKDPSGDNDTDEADDADGSEGAHGEDEGSPEEQGESSEEADGEVGSEADDEEGQDDGGSRAAGEKADAEDEAEVTNAELEQAPESSPFQGADIENLGPDLATAIAMIVTNEATRNIKGLDYRVYTRDWDVHEKFPAPDGNETVTKEMQIGRRYERVTKKVSDLVVELDERTGHMVAPMQKDIERMMAARSQVLKVPGYRSGRLHSGSLHRLATGDDRVFRRVHEHKSQETAVSLLIDNSGSMDERGKMTVAMAAGYALSQTLQRVNIKHEVTGFTTMPPRGFKGYEWIEEQRAEEERIGREFSRMGALYLPIYKAFDERVTPEVKRRFAAAPFTCSMQGNTDGESVRYAGQRLMLRPEPRKVLIVLSDGHPAGMSNFSDEIYSDLHKAVEECEKAKIETVGVGILSDAVRTFYPKCVVLNELNELPKAVMAELKRILLP